MNEAETRAEYIDPALAAAGWGVAEGSRIRREYELTKGRLEGNGKRGKALRVDYVLVHRNARLAVVEAKARDFAPTEGVAQAKDYAGRLAARFAYSTNGLGIHEIDMQEGTEGAVAAFPSPEVLWNRAFGEPNEWRDRFAAVDFEDKGGSFQARYYQDLAVERALAAVAAGRERILLTLATGTGKTCIAFQIAWKLFHSRWNLSRKPTRRPRILFLADRNILADQAVRDFSAFPDDAIARIKPDEIRKKGKVPTNAHLFFTIFQTFMSGPEKDGEPSPYFGEYARDFFDFIVIDECHRGGAKDESSWRGILEYFAPAVQLGLTATPKRKDNVDTYAWFGEPVYVYSLKEGINDGFLTPFRVKQISTTIDEYQYVPGDVVLEGEVEYGKTYQEPDFNRRIEIMDRERHRVRRFLEQIGPAEKTLVFCVDQAHALAVRDLVNESKKGNDPNYCHRVCAADGSLGEQWLRDFQDNEKTIPTVLTTSTKLSTGVDARNVRNIVLMRPVNSMIEFKQIVGRGTRLYEGKDYFTIYDFVKAYRHFSDPEWDGEPIAPEPGDGKPKTGDDPPDPPGPKPDKGDGPGPRPPKIRIKLADQRVREIQDMMQVSFWHPDGSPMSAAQFLEALFGKLPEFFQDEEGLRTIWSDPDTRRKLLDALEEKGFGREQLGEMQRILDAEKSDLYDVLAYVMWARPTRTREERAERAKAEVAKQFDAKRGSFLGFVLDHYVGEGVEELDGGNLVHLIQLKYGGTEDGLRELGPTEAVRGAFFGFQRFLYAPPSATGAGGL